MPASGLLTLAVLGLVLNGCAGPVVPDLVITNARVFTNDPARPRATAVAMKGERVVAVGTDAQALAAKGAATRVVDAGGRVLVPGFNDARVDLPLEPPTPAGLATLDRAALTRGVTSLQVVAGGPIRLLVDAARQATRQARWRLIRSPADTTTLATNDPRATVTEDEDPYLPPQPGVRLVANGVSWMAGGSPSRDRRGIEEQRVSIALGWAYGAEDPIVMAGAVPRWLDALTGVGLPDVWKRKRPRLDVEAGLDDRWVPGMAKYGVVLTVVPPAEREAAGEPLRAWYMLSPFLDGGIVLAAGSGGAPAPMAVLAVVTREQPPSPGPRVRPLSREEAVRAMTWGSAYAEKAERDKGWIGPGTLADLAVLSDDIFTVPADRLPGITSVFTVVGGTIVYDAGVLPH